MPDYSELMGRHYDPEATEAILATAENPFFVACSHSVMENSGMGKTQLLYKFVEAVLGEFPELVQAIGDCTSFSAGHGIITLACTEIAKNGEFESFDKSGISTEFIYACSRVLIGNGQLGNQDGSMGAWTVAGLQKYGTLRRQKYNNIDLTNYDPNKARQWGSPRNGPPKELISIAQKNKIRTYSLVETVEQAVNGIHNGYPVLFCSGQGFTTKRDSDGFLKPQGSWPHAMCGIAQDTEYKRPGILIENSWPSGWVTGPKRHEQPSGSFWVDLDTIRRMISERDTFIISDYDGYPAKDINWEVFTEAQKKAKEYK